mgnify:CR=1 FL=1
MTPKEVELDLERIGAEFEEFIAAYPDLAESVSDLIALLALVREQREQLATKDAEIERLRGEISWAEELLVREGLIPEPPIVRHVVITDPTGTRDSSRDVTNYYPHRAAAAGATLGPGLP